MNFAYNELNHPSLKFVIIVFYCISNWDKLRKEIEECRCLIYLFCLLKEKPSASLIKDVICAFKAAVKQAGHETEVNKYRVEGSKGI